MAWLLVMAGNMLHTICPVYYVLSPITSTPDLSALKSMHAKIIFILHYYIVQASKLIDFTSGINSIRPVKSFTVRILSRASLLEKRKQLLLLQLLRDCYPCSWLYGHTYRQTYIRPKLQSLTAVAIIAANCWYGVMLVVVSFPVLTLVLAVALELTSLPALLACNTRLI